MSQAKLPPGTYRISEVVPEGWELQSATCDDGSDPSSIDVANGETVTCIFVNHFPPEVLPVEILPFTGIDGDRLAGISVILLGSGLLLILGARRREES